MTLILPLVVVLVAWCFPSKIQVVLLVVNSELQGRPLPGKCPRKTGDKPHSWVKNRTIG